MSLAKAIQNSDADCGLGTYSATKVFDLDFIPICDEEYDLLVKSDLLESDYIKTLLNVINSQEFKTRVETLGGYNVDEIGKIMKG